MIFWWGAKWHKVVGEMRKCVGEVTQVVGEVTQVVGEMKQFCWGNEANCWGNEAILLGKWHKNRWGDAPNTKWNIPHQCHYQRHHYHHHHQHMSSGDCPLNSIESIVAHYFDCHRHLLISSLAHHPWKVITFTIVVIIAKQMLFMSACLSLLNHNFNPNITTFVGERESISTMLFKFSQLIRRERQVEEVIYKDGRSKVLWPMSQDICKWW